MASNSVVSGYSVTGSTSCAPWPGANVTITVTGPGRVAIEENALVVIAHTAGTPDEIELYLQNSTSGCTFDAWTGVYYVDAAQPTQLINQEISFQNVLNVSQAGTYTFYTIDRAGGGAAVSCYQAGLIATFYPA